MGRWCIEFEPIAPIIGSEAMANFDEVNNQKTSKGGFTRPILSTDTLSAADGRRNWHSVHMTDIRPRYLIIT